MLDRVRSAAEKVAGKAAGRIGIGNSGSSDPLVADLEAALAPARVHLDGAERSLLSHDASVIDGGGAGPVCYPTSTEEVVAIMEIAARHDRAVVPRGAGTGLAGGAIPVGAPIVVALTKMNEIHSVDLANRVAWVGPGVINLDLSKHLHPLGYHFAPDPSSQQVCTIGGNVANNSGGPHCLAYGVTNAHIQALEVVLPSGQIGDARRARPRTAGPRPTGRVRGQRGNHRDRHQDRGHHHQEPTRRPHPAPVVLRRAPRGSDGERRRGRRHRARGHGGDGSAHHPGGRELRRRGLPHRRGGRPTGRARRTPRRHRHRRRPASPRSAGPIRPPT